MLKHFMLSVLLSVLFTGAIGFGLSRAESDCPVKNCNTREEIKAIVKVFNNYIVSKNLGFTFECVNPENGTPILNCYTGLTREHCLQKQEQLKTIGGCISTDWNMYTGSKKINIYNLDKELMFRIDEKGKFILIGRML